MNIKNNAFSIAYCGLICGFCKPDGSCNCKTGNHCGKRLSLKGCYQYNCCTSKGIQGCWECNIFPCGHDMMSAEHVKIRAFVRCIKEDGIENFIGYLNNNANNGFIYHREGIIGDYDLNTEEEVLKLLRTGKL